MNERQKETEGGKRMEGKECRRVGNGGGGRTAIYVSTSEDSNLTKM
jgi:hypothetical protein